MAGRLMDYEKDRGTTSQAAHDNSEPRRAEPTTRRLSFHDDPERGPITAAYAGHLTRCLVAERPDWDPREIGAALDELRDHTCAKLRRAAFRVADTPGSTPSTIALVGPHWDEEKPKPQWPAVTADPEGPVRMCSDHPSVPARDCQDCKKKRKRPPWFEDLYLNEAEKDAQRRAQLKQEQDAAAAAAAAREQARSRP